MDHLAALWAEYMSETRAIKTAKSRRGATWHRDLAELTLNAYFDRIETMLPFVRWDGNGKFSVLFDDRTPPHAAA